VGAFICRAQTWASTVSLPSNPSVTLPLVPENSFSLPA